MGLFNLIKSVYNYFVPSTTSSTTKESVNAESDTTEEGDDIFVNNVDDEDVRNTEIDTELQIQRNERKKAKHEMKKKEQRKRYK